MNDHDHCQCAHGSHETLIIAEAGVNHNGSLKMAKDLVAAAAEAGADVVKFQTFKTDKILTRTAQKADYQKETTGKGETQFEMIRKLELSEPEHRALRKTCREKGISFLSTPFDLESLRFLDKGLNVDAIKIPSGEITNPLLLLEAARTGKPVFLSTGMARLGEIEAALGFLAFGFLRKKGDPDPARCLDAYRSEAGTEALEERVFLLHCTTEYPVKLEHANLRAIETLSSAFQLPVGYSDHTEGIWAPVAAVAMGAVVIEKHFTLDRNLPGPDHKASIDPSQLKEMVASIRALEVALGNGRKVPSPLEMGNAAVARKSLVALKRVRRGQLWTTSNLGMKRPGTGISPMAFWEFLGKAADRDYLPDELVGTPAVPKPRKK